MFNLFWGILFVIVNFGLFLLCYRLFGKKGLYLMGWSCYGHRQYSSGQDDCYAAGHRDDAGQYDVCDAVYDQRFA